MNWLIFAILSALSFGFYNFFTKLSADKFSPAVAIMVLTGTAFLVSLVTVLALQLTGHPLNFSKNWIILPILAGLFAGAAEISYVFMFAKNAPLSIGNPLVVGGTIIVAVALGIIFLKEPLSAIKTAGIALTLGGLLLLARS